MKVNIYQKEHLKENYVDLNYSVLDEETSILKEYLQGFQSTIVGRQREEERDRLIYPAEIFYLEIVDRKCFLYLADSVWQNMQYRLNTFLERYESQGFVRISKSAVVNIYHIRELKADLNMRVVIILDNDEKIVLNRAYKESFYAFLKQMRERSHYDN